MLLACAERGAQVKEGGGTRGMTDVSHQCSEPRAIQMGTTEHDQKIKQPRPSGRRASCPWFLPQKDGPLVGHTIHTSAQHRHQLRPAFMNIS